MFDPTAFENMKVVLEGAVYDRDLIGDVLVVQRDDIVNLSTMERTYRIEFELKEPRGAIHLTGGVCLKASLKNLSAELLAPLVDEKHAGSTVEVFLMIPEKLTKEDITIIYSELERIWGKDRIIAMTERQTSVRDQIEESSCTFTISFGRLVKEEQMDDLADMVDYLIPSLEVIAEKLEKKEH